MPRKFRLGRHCKNEERKKRAQRIQAEVTEEASVAETLVVSLPLNVFLQASLDDPKSLRSRLEASSSLPLGWNMTCEDEKLVLMKIDASRATPDIQYSIRIAADMSWKAFVYGMEIPTVSSVVTRTPPALATVEAVRSLLLCLDKACICEGNRDAKFEELQSLRGFRSTSNAYPTAYIDTGRLLDSPTIRHKNCEVVLLEDSTRCDACKSHRKVLHILFSRISRRAKEKESRTSVSSHVNYCHLSTPEKHERLSKLHDVARVARQRIRRLEERLTKAIETSGEVLDKDTHEGLRSIMSDNDATISEKFPPESFGRLFWEQQKKALQAKSASAMRWHPLMIKWCLHLRHLSGSGYEALRKSGCITLPSQRTLRDYTHFADACSGFSCDVDQQLIAAAEIVSCPEWRKNVVLLLDEMYIREDLVYDKFSGALTGFVDLGSITMHLANFERQMENGSEEAERPLAKTMLVVMVRGLFSGLQFPYVQFPCNSLRGDQMFYVMWKTVGRLERYGFHVLGWTCDGLAANRHLFRLHAPRRSAEVVHKTINPYSPDRDLLFFSDPPHLLKTIRNCFANKNRHLWFNQPISWSHIVKLYLDKTDRVQSLSCVPKLKYEHIYLTSFSKMRVDLAAQVLSGTVAAALGQRGTEVEATAKFVKIVDRVFDCLNVGNYTDGKCSRNPFKQPYRGANDFRLKWLERDFLGYLEDWEKTVEEREGFTANEKKSMLLSDETASGLKLTVKSFVQLAKYVLAMPGVPPLLSRRLSQDSLEKFFGLQRQRGRASENPSVQEFFKNSQALRVVQACSTSVKGNCRGNKDVDLSETTPLRRRNSHSQKP